MANKMVATTSHLLGRLLLKKRKQKMIVGENV